jgi:transcriptional regulator with XRE-family HTH domain
MLFPIEIGSGTYDRNSILKRQGNVAQEKKDFLHTAAMEIDKWILKAREAKGWTQGQLADALDVTRANVSAWENRRHEPSLSQIKKISGICGVNALALLTDDDQGITKLPSRDVWPFSFSPSLLDSISPARRRELELIMLGFIAETTLTGGNQAEKAG